MTPEVLIGYIGCAGAAVAVLILCMVLGSMVLDVRWDARRFAEQRKRDAAER